MSLPRVSAVVLIAFAGTCFGADGPPAREEVVAALRRATEFMHGSVARHGGYVYLTSADLKLREGEGVAGESVIWVQPPGTPAVGEAFLDAYEATGDEVHLNAARDAGKALVLGQLQSGGWYYSITFDPAGRETFFYRLDLDGRPLPERVPAKDRARDGGWEVWKRRKYAGNISTFDDDVTQSAARFLARLDRTLGFEDESVHGAAAFSLAAILNVQYPNGGWSHNYDRSQDGPPSEAEYPVVRASYPESWPRTWPKDFTGCYVTNDDLVSDMIDTLLVAHEVYRDDRSLAAAKRAGDFLILAQMPDPQPAWAQQYDREMHPAWSRAFEPPAVSGRESQTILRALLRLYEVTGDAKYLEPIPRAVAYLRSSLRPDGRLARFYELKTNRPLYFTREGGRHVMTYDDDRVASGYGYIVDSDLAAIEAEYERVKERRASPPANEAKADLAQVRRVLAGQDGRGAWVEPGRMPSHKVEPAGGVIASETFVRNVAMLCRFLRGTGAR